jgi:hypothetical protein
MFCKYKNIFGEVGKGAHSFRIFNIAIIDVVFTILLAYVIHYFIPKYDLIYILIFLFLSGIFFHRLFCVRTTIDKLLF